MLHELRIENLLLIERAELRLAPGLNVITGETGAGKTILAHSLDLLMGGRVRPQIVRPGADEAYVEGVFALPDGLLDDAELGELRERLPDDADEIVLGRRVGTSGRTSAFVQGRSATAADLAALGSRLLAFYGQHEHRKLALASSQRAVLDSFAGQDHLARLAEHREAYAEATALARELEEIREVGGARERELDLLRFELAEIESVAPTAEEEGELDSERERLRHAEGLRGAAGGALGAIAGGDDGGGAREAASSAEEALAGVGGVDGDLDGLAERTRALAIELDDLGRELRSYLDSIDADPGRLQVVEERLAAVDRLRRKHGGSVEAVLEHAERCRGRIAELEGAGERGAEAEALLVAAEQRRAKLAEELTKARSKAGGELESRVAAELEQLAMEGATLRVELEPHPDSFGATGAEVVTFSVATNPGMEPAPLRDAASGGELSRLMLALCGLGAGEGAASYVFDEIDAGVGGKVARTVGERLRSLSSSRQVVCITHLPQVASLAEAHFRITKSISDGAALAGVDRLSGEDVVAEICRMLGADEGDAAASRHARELLRAA